MSRVVPIPMDEGGNTVSEPFSGPPPPPTPAPEEMVQEVIELGRIGKETVSVAVPFTEARDMELEESVYSVFSQDCGTT